MRSAACRHIVGSCLSSFFTHDVGVHSFVPETLFRIDEDCGENMCKVLIADDCDVIRSAIRKRLQEEAFIEIVGEASSFAQTIQMVGDLRPDVLLLDLRMAEKRQFAPDLVKLQLGTVCTVAISFAYDSESKSLAESYGAATLLDKMTLYTEMVPAIRQFRPELTLSKRPLRRATNAASL